MKIIQNKIDSIFRLLHNVSNDQWEYAGNTNNFKTEINGIRIVLFRTEVTVPFLYIGENDTTGYVATDKTVSISLENKLVAYFKSKYENNTNDSISKVYDLLNSNNSVCQSNKIEERENGKFILYYKKLLEKKQNEWNDFVDTILLENRIKYKIDKFKK